MQWEIICYNGERYKSGRQELLTEFIERWKGEFNQFEINIKRVINHS
jgi:hypothetical protein